LTIFAELVDVSKGGLHCVVPDARSILKVGGRIDSPLTLERDDPKFRLRLNVAGTVTWHTDTAVGTHLGFAFTDRDELDDTEVEQLQGLLAK
jgi:hypothetical protein